MKKNLKKMFSSLLAAALVLTGAGLPAVTAQAEGETVAYLSFADNSWSVQYWNDGNDYSPVVATTAEVTGSGTYTVGLDFTGVEGGAPDIAFFDVEISNGETAFPNSYMTIDSVVINGEEVELTGTPYTSSDDGVATRTNLYNSWVTDATTVDNARTADGSAEGITPTPVAGDTITDINTIEVTFTLGDGVLCNAAAGGEDVLSEESYPAFIAFGGDVTEGDWGFQYYGDGASSNMGDIVATDGELKNGETTTLTLEFPSEVYYTWFTAPCFVAEDASAISANSTFEVKVLLDGEEIATDLTAGKSCWAEATGDYSETQCVRIGGGYNEWGDKYIAESPAGFTTLTFEITPTIYISSAAPAEEETSAAGPVDLNGTYNAYIGFQTPKYSFRNAFDDATYGRDTDYFNVVTGWDASNNAVTLDGTFTDAVIAGNGTYTVSVDGLAFPDGEFADQEYMNLIFLSTDIPNTGEITISDVELTVDGRGVDLGSAGAIVSPDSKDYLNILIQNIWNDDVKEIGYYATPMTGMSITFTVSGFAYDAEVTGEAPAETEVAAEPAATEAPAETSGSNTGLIIGIVVVVVIAVAVVAGVMVAKKKK